MFFNDAFESTCPKVAEREPYIQFRADRSTAEGLFVFCDGSSSGWHGACLVDPALGKVFHRQRFREPTSNRNVGAEFAGLHLALSMLPAQSDATLVFDMLGLAQWMLGHFRQNDPMVKRACEVCWDLIDSRGHTISWVHHRGHQKDPSDFTHFNNVVDKLCQPGALTGGRVMVSSIKKRA
jgi:hypothetical protein